jgi:hypothetical protein
MWRKNIFRKRSEIRTMSAGLSAPSFSPPGRTSATRAFLHDHSVSAIDPPGKGFNKIFPRISPEAHRGRHDLYLLLLLLLLRLKRRTRLEGLQKSGARLVTRVRDGGSGWFDN